MRRRRAPGPGRFCSLAAMTGDHMRVPIKAGRRLVLAASAGVLLAGSALAAATLPAHAASAPAASANVITLSANPGAQTTDPVATGAPITITATESVTTDTLT